MDATKKLLRNLPEHLLYFLATDVICMILSFAVNMILRPILLETARGDAAKEQTVETILLALFAILFFVVLAVIFAKSPIQRTSYLSATIGRKYSFFGDLKVFLKGGLWIGVAAYAIFSLIPTIFLWLFPDVLVLPTVFYSQYALTELCGAWIAYAVGIVAYALFSLLLFPCLHLYWEKNRLYR